MSKEVALNLLRHHKEGLRALGVRHAAVFGSVARGEQTQDSDIDVLVELDDDRVLGLFEYSRIRLTIAEILNGKADVVNRRALKPLLSGNILLDAVYAF